MTKHIDLDALRALAPCPFCGKTESVRLTTTHEAWDDEEIYPDCAVVVCDASSAAKLGGCGASSSCHETEAEAITAWNRRADTGKSAQGKGNALSLTPAGGKERQAEQQAPCAQDSQESERQADLSSTNEQQAVAWQPIEAAPDVKGDFFFCHLAWGPEDDQTTGDGFRWNGRWFAAAAFYALGKERKFEMREIEVKPTHFMPKPPAPASSRTEELPLPTCEEEFNSNSTPAAQQLSEDRNVEDLREMLRQRSVVGLKKYGVTTCRNPLEMRDWLQHAIEETLDNAVYLRQAVRMLDAGLLESQAEGK